MYLQYSRALTQSENMNFNSFSEIYPVYFKGKNSPESSSHPIIYPPEAYSITKKKHIQLTITIIILLIYNLSSF